MRFPKVWELIDRFKERSKLIGWKTSGREDVVKREGECCNFIWIRVIHPSTFKRVVSHRKIGMREGVPHRVVDVECTAWLCKESPFESIKKIIEEDPTILKRNAIYDLSRVHADGVCEKINETASMVFKEFEAFLQSELGVKLKPVRFS